jgi:hypothetical protein
LAKIDKRQFTKEQWQEIRAQRKADKQARRLEKAREYSVTPSTFEKSNHHIAFVLGNGTSRSPINVEELSPIGKTYGCNALYRTFAPDFLVAVDVKMILEISKTGYQKKHTVWTNPNKAYQRIPNLNLFNPSKGWSSGPTALWLSAQHGYERIYILGFDYKGLEKGSKFNNIFADTPNYKKSQDGATFFGNWLRQTVSVVKENKNTQFVRVIAPDNYQPEELNKFDNFTTITVEDFMKIFQLS